MKKIKILRIVARLNIGGPAIHTILLSAGLDKNSFETLLVTGRPGEREGDMFFLAEEKNVRPIIIPELGRSLNPFKDLVSFWKIFFLINREKPDIIHTHTAKAGALGRLAGLLYKCLHPNRPVKLVHTFHGHVLHGYFGRLKSAIFIRIERALALFTDRIIAVSESVKKELIRLKVARKDKIVTVPLGLELGNFLEIKRNGVTRTGSKTIATVGRMVPVKNQKMFLEAAKRVKELIGSRQGVKFLVIGDGPLRGNLEDYARRLGIDQDVVFTGWVKDLAGMYRDIDIVTLTSFNEGTPVALIEAQAAGCPCVATDVGGVADVIAQGKNGFLSPAQETESFARQLLKLLQEPDLARSMGEYGRKTVRDRFAKERLVGDIEGLYRELTAV